MTTRAIFRSVRLPALIAAVVAVACTTRYYEPTIAPTSAIAEAARGGVLKLHMRDGDLLVLDTWTVDSSRVIRGSGVRHNVWREQSQRLPDVTIPADSAALIETDSATAAVDLGHFLVGAIMVGQAKAAIDCARHPKSCFGSCPTFYVDGDEPERIRAEGFSESVARVLERRDVDALGVTGARGTSLTLRMRNEAMETHMVRRVNLLAARRPVDGRVFAIGDTAFVAVRGIQAPSTCRGRNGDCRTLLANRDDGEWTSRADPGDLASRESLELVFERAPEQPALVITSRKSLVTTFLFYQTLAWLGRSAPTLLATIERGTKQQAEDYFAMARVLGNVEVQIPTDSGWTTVGEVGEAGPIAADTKVLPLPRDAFRAAQPARIRLVLARGNWRLDWVALGSLGESVGVQRLAPVAVEYNGRANDAARVSLTRATSHVVAMPGDEYALRYELPANASALDLFIESEGFYYEWMRQEWLAEENALLAAQSLADPAGALRRLAPAFASRESTMEKVFWASRVNRRQADAR